LCNRPARNLFEQIDLLESRSLEVLGGSKEMASVSAIIAKLGSSKTELQEAKTEVDGGTHATKEMITQAEAMELATPAERLTGLHGRIEVVAERIVGLLTRLDGLITAAEAFRSAAPS
jgi:hypothetical protein